MLGISKIIYSHLELGIIYSLGIIFTCIVSLEISGIFSLGIGLKGEKNLISYCMVHVGKIYSNLLYFELWVLRHEVWFNHQSFVQCLDWKSLQKHLFKPSLPSKVWISFIIFLPRASPNFEHFQVIGNLTAPETIPSS